MKQKRKAIGILGGMGPGASAYLYRLLIDKSIRDFGAKHNEDFPEIILYSIPVPDFISNNKNQEKALRMLKERVSQLKSCRLSSISIACNTAHILVDDLKMDSKTPFISMIGEVSKHVFKSKLRKVGILGTPSTLRLRLYQKELEKFRIETIIPEEKEIETIEKIIRNVLGGELRKKDKAEIKKIADSLIAKGAEGIILGCTELPLIFSTNNKFPIFNSVDILSEVLLRDYYKSNTI